MTTWHEWVRYVRDLHNHIQAQEQKIAELDKKLQSVKTEMNALKEQKPIHIDKIEYKFDQLKVEKLDGTLNIGITPKMIEDMAVGAEGQPAAQTAEQGQGTAEQGTEQNATQQAALTSQPLSELQGQLQAELYRYVQQDVPKRIRELEARSGHSLDPWHRQMIQEDLGRQVGQRMMYYLQQMEKSASADQMSSIKDSVLFRTKNDLNTALNNYFSKMPKKDGKTNELSSDEP